MELQHVLGSAIVGSPHTVRRGLSDFLTRTNADELIIAAQIFDHAARLHSYEIVAQTRQSAVGNRESGVSVDSLSR